MNWTNVDEIFSKSDFDMDSTIHFNNPDLTNRLKKTLYYSPNKNPTKDTLSFSVTKAAVESFRKAAPTSCGKLGLRYASRVARDACLSPCAMLLAMIYVERLIHKNPDYLQRIQSSDLFLVTMMVASKYLYDEGTSDEVYNDEWAISGLADTDYVNALESDFLHAIDWGIFTRQEEFSNRLMLMEARLAYVEGYQRGWLTYTDMNCLLQSKKVVQNLLKIARFLSKIICFSVTVYCGVVMAGCGLTLLARHQALVSHSKPVESYSKENNTFVSEISGAADNDHVLVTVESQSSLPVVDSQHLEDSVSVAPSSSSFVIKKKQSLTNDNQNHTSTFSKHHTLSDFSENTVLIESNFGLPNFNHQRHNNSFLHQSTHPDKNYTKCNSNVKIPKNEATFNSETKRTHRTQPNRHVQVQSSNLVLKTDNQVPVNLLNSVLFNPSLSVLSISHFQHHHCTLSAVQIF